MDLELLDWVHNKKPGSRAPEIPQNLQQNEELIKKLILETIISHSSKNDNSVFLDQLLTTISNQSLIDYENEIKNTPLMIACEEGQLELVRILLNHNANITQQNEYKQTAFILAIEKNHLDILRFLYQQQDKFPNQLTHENKYAKSALFVACEFAKPEIVSWLLETGLSPLKSNSRGIFPLMLACAGPMSDARLRVVDQLILKCPSCVNCVNNANETVLHWASIQGHGEIVRKVFRSRHFDIKHIDNVSDASKFGDGKTALLRAVTTGDEECVELLLSHGANFHFEFINSLDSLPIDAFQMAWLQGFPKIATKYFMLNEPKDCNESYQKYCLLKNIDFKEENSFQKYSLLKNLDLKITEVFTDAQIQLIAKRLANTNNISHLQDLVHYAGIYEFHFNLFIDIVFPMFTSPNIALNKTIDFFFSSLQHRNFSHVQLVSHLVRLAAALTTAIEEHPLEQTDLKKRLDTVESMLTECVSCDSMDDRKNIELVMCSDNKEFYENRIVQYSQAFLSGPVRTCLDFHITSIFSTVNLSLFIEEIFWSYLKRSEERDFNIVDIDHAIFKLLKIPELEESRNIRNLQSNLIHGRYCPAFMLFAEGASKAFFLFLISATSMALYSPGIEGTSTQLQVIPLKRVIYVFLLTLFFYEIGQLCNHTTQILPTKKSIAGYFNEVWNYLDMFGIILVMLWIGSRQHYDHTLSGLLPTAAVFYACSLLRYLSVHEELGKLVIMIFAMSADLAVFGIVYLICVAGFTVAIWALFSGVDGLHSFMDVFLFLCSITMGNTPFDAFNGSPYSSIGMTLVFCFLVFTGIILINLVIARMSATHDRINETSFQEWQFDRATTTDSFILIEERHPFCMLPAPLNLLTIAISPIHWLVISQNLKLKSHDFSSIAGTTSDLLLGFVMSFVAPFLELLYYDYSIIRTGKIFPALEEPSKSNESETLPSKAVNFSSYLLEFVVINLIFIVIYPIYICTLILETLKCRTHLSYTVTADQTPIFKVNYKLRKYIPLPDPKDWAEKDDDLILNIKVLRCADLLFPETRTEATNPVLKLRFGRVEISTPESVNGTKNPNWPNCVLQIPKSEIDKSHGKNVEEVKFIDIAVYDRDQVTGKETLVLEKKHAIDLNQLFSTGRLEGDVNLGPVPFDPKSSPRMSLAAIVLKKSVLAKQTVEEKYTNDIDEDEDEDEDLMPAPSNSSHQSRALKVVLPDESKILRRLKSKLDPIFLVSDLKKIFLDVDTLQDSEYQRDYQETCQRASDLVHASLRQFRHFKSTDTGTTSLSLFMSLEEFIQSFRKATHYLFQPTFAGISGPYLFKMEKCRLQTLLELTSLKMREEASVEFTYLIDHPNTKPNMQKRFRDKLAHFLDQCQNIFVLALRELKRLLVSPVSDSHISQSFRFETPMIKNLKTFIQKEDAKMLSSSTPQTTTGEGAENDQKQVDQSGEGEGARSQEEPFLITNPLHTDSSNTPRATPRSLLPPSQGSELGPEPTPEKQKDEFEEDFDIGDDQLFQLMVDNFQDQRLSLNN